MTNDDYIIRGYTLHLEDCIKRNLTKSVGYRVNFIPRTYDKLDGYFMCELTIPNNHFAYMSEHGIIKKLCRNETNIYEIADRIINQFRKDLLKIYLKERLC